MALRSFRSIVGLKGFQIFNCLSFLRKTTPHINVPRDRTSINLTWQASSKRASPVQVYDCTKRNAWTYLQNFLYKQVQPSHGKIKSFTLIPSLFRTDIREKWVLGFCQVSLSHLWHLEVQASEIYNCRAWTVYNLYTSLCLEVVALRLGTIDRLHIIIEVLIPFTHSSSSQQQISHAIFSRSSLRRMSVVFTVLTRSSD